MKIHEYQGKELFRQAGVPVLEGIVASTADEAVAAYEKLGSKIAVVKSQITPVAAAKGPSRTILTNVALSSAKVRTK